MTRSLRRASSRRKARLGVVEFRPQPIPEVVGLAREVLRRAESGEIMALGVAAVHADGAIANAYEVGTSWAGLLAGASCLRRRLEDVS